MRLGDKVYLILVFNRAFLLKHLKKQNVGQNGLFRQLVSGWDSSLAVSIFDGALSSILVIGH